jgi:hypothetical protein
MAADEQNWRKEHISFDEGTGSKVPPHDEADEFVSGDDRWSHVFLKMAKSRCE